MPYPSQVSYEEIVTAARALVEAGGAAGLSLKGVAQGLGVRAPSLYRYIDGRDALLQAVNLATLRDLMAALEEAGGGQEVAAAPAARLRAIAAAYRAFALAHPYTYTAAFASRDETRPDEEILLQMALPLQALVAALAGEAQALALLRGLLALVHGYVMLEVHQQLRRGGNLEQDFQAAVSAYLRGAASFSW